MDESKLKKELLKSLENYEVELVKECIEQTNLEGELIEALITKALRKPENIKVHDLKGRKKRDNFFKSLLEVLINHEQLSCIKTLRNKVRIIHASEALFDEIKSTLKKCEIEKIPVNKQVWAHIERAEGEYENLNRLIEKQIAKKPKGNLHFTPSFSLIKDDEGQEFDPDGVSEKINESLSLILSLLAYREKYYQASKAILPERISVSDEDKYKAGSTQLFAIAWKALEDISYRALLFGGDVDVREGNDVPDDAKNKGIKTSVHFIRSESGLEIFDSISNQRQSQKIFQHSFELSHEKGIQEIVVKDINDLAPTTFLSIEELAARIAIEDVFCINLSSDESTYGELTLYEWLRGYSCLQYIANQITYKKVSSVIDEEGILSYLSKCGLSSKAASIFLLLTSFGQDSQDLFDCPLIKMKDNNFYIFYPPLTHVNLATVLLSRLSSMKISVDRKGKAFEESVINKIKKYFPTCKGFKFTKDGKEYEYDAVLIIDDHVFILECKNRSLSSGSAVNIYRKEKFLLDCAKQVKRQQKALIENPDIFKREFNKDINDFTVIPVVLNCMTFSWAGMYEGVYFSDFSSLSRFFSSQSINEMTSIYENKARVLKPKPVFQLWSGDQPSAKDLLKHFDMPIQLKYHLLSREKEALWLPAGELAFTIERYSTSSEVMLRHQKVELGIKENKVIDRQKILVNKKKQKRKNAKKSRVKNRKK